MTDGTGVSASDHESYWRTVVAADERAARAVVEDVVARGVSVEAALTLVTTAQERVGALWASNEWTVDREHAATAIGETVVRRLGERITPPAGAPHVLVACVEREWHALPALVVTQVLRARGLHVEYLGAHTSRDLVVTRIVDSGPRAVLLSSSLSSSLTRVRQQVEAIRGTGTPVVVGGRAFDREGVRAHRLGATAHVLHPDELPTVLDRLPRHVPPAPALTGPAVAEARALHSTTEDISHDVVASVRAGTGSSPDGGKDRDDWRVVLSTFVPHVVDCLSGALLIDDATVVSEARTWLTDVLARRSAAPHAVAVLWEALRVRLHDYPEALRLLAAS